MATTGEEEVEYESDPEEVKRSLGMRRREAASDDEEVENEEALNRRDVILSDESNDQSGVDDYDDEEELELEEDEEVVVVEEVYDDDEEIEEDAKRAKEDVKEAVMSDGNGNADEVVEINNGVDDGFHVGEEGEEEKKENEPFSVPTAGAFYMHDDRYRDNAVARHRRTQGGRKLWESKDNGKWGHDKFEEMTSQEKHYQDGRRSSRGRYRAWSKNRDQDGGYPRGSRPNAFEKSNNQNHAPKAVRGRGPRRYEPTMRKSDQAPSTRNRPSGKPLERTSQANSSRAFTPETNADTASAPARKHFVESSLSYASPPFYPSGSSNKDISVTQRKDVQPGSLSRKFHPSFTDEKFSSSQSDTLQGKNALDTLSMEKLYIDDSSTSASVKPLTNMQMLPSGSSFGNTGHSSQSRIQGRGVSIPGQKAYQPASHQNQVNRVSSPTQVNSAQRSNIQGRALSSVQAAAQQLGQQSGIGSQASSLPKTAVSVSSNESGEVELSESSKSKGALVSKGKSSAQGAGRGSFVYGGAQIMGATGGIAVNHGDKNIPAFLPVMQFGGQHPGGLPAVGMAFPGYVAQPQLGRGNSEMTWLPVLTGGAGALGAQYCPPYIAVDGSYHARPAGQISSTGSSSKENTSSKPSNEWKPSLSQRTEPVSDEFGQRPNNPNKQPRRYSEMSFNK